MFSCIPAGLLLDGYYMVALSVKVYIPLVILSLLLFSRMLPF